MKGFSLIEVTRVTLSLVGHIIIMEFTSSNHDRKLQKCHPTGWRIEQKYSPGVLIGNWYESSHGKVLIAGHKTTVIE